MASPATAPLLTGQVSIVMNNLVEMEKRVHDDLHVSMWRPTAPDPPALWNWLQPSQFAIVDQVKWRDTLNVVATIAIAHTDVEIEMARLVTYIDAFRNVVDAELYAKRPLGAHRAKRLGMQSSVPRFGNVVYLGMEFALQLEIDRMIQPNA